MASYWTTPNAVRNFAGAFLAAYGVAAFFCFVGLVMMWANSGPTSPDPEHGFIYPHNEHGSITYFSAFQATGAALLFATSIPLSFIGMSICPKKNIVARTGKLSFHAKWDMDDPHGVSPWGFGFGALFAPAFIFLVGPLLVGYLNSVGFKVSF
jgi:hypothetical protein